MNFSFIYLGATLGLMYLLMAVFTPGPQMTAEAGLRELHKVGKFVHRHKDKIKIAGAAGLVAAAAVSKKKKIVPIPIPVPVPIKIAKSDPIVIDHHSGLGGYGGEFGGHIGFGGGFDGWRR